MAAQSTLDPSPVRLVKVPDGAPPLDCEVVGTAPAVTFGSTDFPVLPQWPAAGAGLERSAVTGPTAAPEREDWRQHEDWRQFARLLTETMAGLRPMRQILPWLTDRARVQLRKAVPVVRCGQRPRVMRVLASWPDDSVAELSVIIGLGPRTRALAVRMEKTSSQPGQPLRWLCTDIETG